MSFEVEIFPLFSMNFEWTWGRTEGVNWLMGKYLLRNASICALVTSAWWRMCKVQIGINRSFARKKNMTVIENLGPGHRLFLGRRVLFGWSQTVPPSLIDSCLQVLPGSCLAWGCHLAEAKQHPFLLLIPLCISPRSLHDERLLFGWTK